VSMGYGLSSATLKCNPIVVHILYGLMLLAFWLPVLGACVAFVGLVRGPRRVVALIGLLVNIGLFAVISMF